MELYRPRSLSIPRHLRQIPAHERFTVAGAAQLKLHVQALDNHLDLNVDAATLSSTFESRPFHEEIYVDGSEEFYLLVKGTPRPDLIPKVYIEALTAAQQGRFPINEHVFSDFRKGVDCNFSEIRLVLPRIDEMCGTRLLEHYRVFEDAVKPFPFLDLPTELRLEVYSMLLPREDHIAILSQPTGEHKPPQVRMDLLRVNQQLYQEVVKYFYSNRTLFMIAARDKSSAMFSNEYMSRYYEVVASVGPQIRQHFTKLEIHVGHLSEQQFFARKYLKVPYSKSPMQSIITLLPNLKTVVISVRQLAIVNVSHSPRLYQRSDTIEWLMNSISDDIDVQWACVANLRMLSPQSHAEDEAMRAPIARRGPIMEGTSVITGIEAEHAKRLMQTQMANLAMLAKQS